MKSSDLVKNVSWLMVARIYALLVNALVGVILVRYLGPGRNGDYNYIISFVAIFSGISMMGLENVITKEVANESRSIDNIIGSSIVVRAIGFVIAFLFVCVGTFFVHGANIRTGIIVYAVLLLSSNILSGVTSLCYARNCSNYVAISQVVAHTIRALFTIGLIYNNKGIEYFVVLLAGEAWITLAIQWLIILKRKIVLAFSASRDTVKYFINQGLPIVLGSIAITVNLKIDQLMIGNMRGSYELGVYSVAVRIAELWYFIPTTIVAVLVTNLTETRKKDDLLYQKMLQKSFSIMTGLGYLAGIVTSIFAQVVVINLFGEEYSDAVKVLYIYIWAGIFINTSVLRGGWYVIEEKTKYSLYCNVIGAISNVIINLVLIPRFGGMGAAVATFISYMIYAYLSSFIFKPLREIGMMQTRAILLKGLWK